MQINEQLKVRAGTFVAAVLAADGVVHAYWAAGGIWPATDSRSIMRAILDIDKPIEPAVVATLSGLLFLGAATALARVDRLGPIGRRIPHRLTQFGILTIAGATLLRGLAGLGWMVRGDTSEIFTRLNLALWTPACFILFAAAVLAARSQQRSPIASAQPESAAGRVRA